MPPAVVMDRLDDVLVRALSVKARSLSKRGMSSGRCPLLTHIGHSRQLPWAVTLTGGSPVMNSLCRRSL